MKTKKIIAVQVIFLALVLSTIYFIYPKSEVSVSGNFVRFSSNAEYIIISDSQDFSNPRYIEIPDADSFSLSLEPGVYYIKASNGLIKGFSRRIEVKSQVSLEIKNESLVNVGNVEIDVEKTSGGILSGRIILGPEQSEKINVSEKSVYKGGQNG